MVFRDLFELFTVEVSSQSSSVICERDILKALFTHDTCTTLNSFKDFPKCFISYQMRIVIVTKIREIRFDDPHLCNTSRNN